MCLTPFSTPVEVPSCRCRPSRCSACTPPPTRGGSSSGSRLRIAACSPPLPSQATSAARLHLIACDIRLSQSTSRPLQGSQAASAALALAVGAALAPTTPTSWHGGTSSAPLPASAAAASASAATDGGGGGGGRRGQPRGGDVGQACRLLNLVCTETRAALHEALYTTYRCHNGAAGPHWDVQRIGRALLPLGEGRRQAATVGAGIGHGHAAIRHVRLRIAPAASAGCRTGYIAAAAADGAAATAAATAAAAGIATSAPAEATSRAYQEEAWTYPQPTSPHLSAAQLGLLTSGLLHFARHIAPRLPLATELTLEEHPELQPPLWGPLVWRVLAPAAPLWHQCTVLQLSTGPASVQSLLPRLDAYFPALRQADLRFCMADKVLLYLTLRAPATLVSLSLHQAFHCEVLCNLHLDIIAAPALQHLSLLAIGHVTLHIVEDGGGSGGGGGAGGGAGAGVGASGGAPLLSSISGFCDFDGGDPDRTAALLRTLPSLASAQACSCFCLPDGSDVVGRLQAALRAWCRPGSALQHLLFHVVEPWVDLGELADWAAAHVCRAGLRLCLEQHVHPWGYSLRHIEVTPAPAATD